ncbi:DUF7033 domain-containing protein [Salinivibrio socompensis]|uniref:DUF7033 domain-containing protein n=1 Tax=Salinivibrio socompensis TaxID=1510206 RepID=UPI0004ADDEA7|nr:hypothetical protein [Salinivibrio socompensis]
MINFSDGAMRWLESILFERFGRYFILAQQSNTLQLSLDDGQGAITFDRLESVFHQARSDFSCKQWQASSEGYFGPVEDVIPAPSEIDLPEPLIELNEKGATIHYDILGLIYWMLTRLEEVRRTDLDSHQRFPATSSHAYRHGYLERPDCDEWLNVLGQVIQRVWSSIELKQHRI